MHLLLSFGWSLLLMASVKDGGAPLRAGCDESASVVKELPAGTELTIRFSLSGQKSPCYKVQAKMGNSSAEGYLSGDAILGLESFDEARKKGGRLEVRDVLDAVGVWPPAARVAGAGSSDPNSKAQEARIARLEEASHYIEISQPARAMALLAPDLKTTRDPSLLALAGAAAWRSDEPERALELWQRSLAIDPNPQVQALYDQVLRETQGDRSQHRIYGTRVLLRYEGTAISNDTAREMAKVVDQEYARVSSQLGCVTDEKIVTIAQSREAYRKTTAAAEWSGGQYDGRIHIPVFDPPSAGGHLDEQTRRTLAHETTHACLTMLGPWPSWFHEGVAQYVSGDRLPASERAGIRELARAGKLPSLDRMDGSWSGLSTDNARVAYAVALRAIEIFEKDFSGYGLRNLLRNPAQLPHYTAELDKRMGE